MEPGLASPGDPRDPSLSAHDSEARTALEASCADPPIRTTKGIASTLAAQRRQASTAARIAATRTCWCQPNWKPRDVGASFRSATWPWGGPAPQDVHQYFRGVGALQVVGEVAKEGSGLLGTKGRDLPIAVRDAQPTQ